MSSSPRYFTDPSAQPFVASRPMTDIMVWLLPEPDSPTIATVSPGLMSRSMPLTAWRMPSPVRKRTLRSRTARTGSVMSAVLRVEGVAQAVADEVQAEQDRHERDGRIDQHPW